MDETLGERFDGERCKRHGEKACPSCLTYTVRDLQAEVRRLGALTRGPVTVVSGIGCDPITEGAIRRAERERCARFLEAEAKKSSDNSAWDHGYVSNTLEAAAEQLRALPDEEPLAGAVLKLESSPRVESAPGSPEREAFDKAIREAAQRELDKPDEEP